ncbi:MAG: NAD(P)H-binding protein [Marivibrio sp.]|uniref:NAD(P)-dependent oxidoreductase n=1 Tax=Marivibrio sp. TaxID=2039719 RepID=UPI0032EBFB61
MTDKPKTLLVVGASKGVGLETVRRALETGWRVKAFARSAGSMSLRDPKLTLAPGDAREEADLAAALDGVDAVALTLGVPADRRMITGPITLFSQATRALVAAMEGEGESPRVSRLVCLTGFGAGVSRRAIHPLQRPPFELLLGRAYRDKDRQEEIVKASRLDWTLVRPGVLAPGPRTGRYRVRLSPDAWRNGLITRADVADYIVRAAGDRTTIGAEPVLTGC